MKKLSKAIALVLTLAVVLSMSSFNALAAISGNGSMESPYNCETATELDGIKVTISADATLYYCVQNAASETLNVADSTGKVSIVGPRGNELGANIDGVATLVLDPFMTGGYFGLKNNGDVAVEVTLSVAGPELGSEGNPATVEKNTSIGNAYIMNTELEAGDSDGYWYSVTAEEDGIFYVEATSSTDDACCVRVEADGYSYTLDEGNPVITYRVEKGTEILVNVSMDYDSSWNFPAGKVYVSGHFVEGTEEDPVLLKTSPVRVPVVAGETVYVQDGSKAIFADTGLLISGYAIADVEVAVGTTTYTDKDGDGKIELVLGGDYYSRPVIAITNNASYNTGVTLTVVDYAREGFYEPKTDHELTYTAAVEAGCHFDGNIEYWYCEECDVFYADEACTQIVNYKTVVVPATGGDVVHVDEVKPGCHMNGNIEYWYCNDCEKVWSDEALTQLTNHKNVIIPAIGGDVVHVEAVEPGCHMDGNMEHWYCTKCELVWSDENLTQITNHKNVVIAATGCDVVHVEAVEPGCHNEGNIEYWYCTKCNQVWANKELTQLTNFKNVILPATGGEVVYVEAVTPGCESEGNIEHWYCEECEKVWSDEDLTQLTNHKSVILPATCQSVVHVEAKDPTCHENGNVEYWYCEDCGTAWANEALTQITNHKNVIISATAKIVHEEAVAPGCHFTGNVEHWYCTGCETVWTDADLTKVSNHKSVIIPELGGDVNHVEAATPSCEETGNIEYWYCEECEQVWTDEARTQLSNFKSVILPAECQNVTHVDAVEPGCHTTGNIEYWYCEDCNQVWQDEARMQLTNFKNVIVPSVNNVVYMEAVAPGCHYEGHVEHYYCEGCEGVWLDAELTKVTNHKSVVLPELGGDVIHVDAVTPGCETTGNIEYWYCEECEQVWTDEARTQLSNFKNVVLPERCQNVVHVDAVEPGCHTVGNIEYWYCKDCNQVWQDEAREQLTNFKRVIVPPVNNVVYMEAVAPGCHYEGHVEHWYCEGCETVWTDAGLTQVSNHKSVIIPELGGDVTHVDAVEPGCHYEGNIEYWYCEECEQVWQDEALTQLTNFNNVIVPATVELVHIEAVTPGCHFDGNVEYWYCTGCECVWTDATLTQVSNLKSVVLPATGEGNVIHMEAIAPGCHFEGQVEHWYCTECEQVWQNPALTQLTNHKNVIIPALGGAVEHVEAVTPSCTTGGNVEYWFCGECDKYWTDENLTQLTNRLSVNLPATCQNVVHVEAVAPGCHFTGNIEHWYCLDCETVWADEERAQVTNHNNVIIPATGEGNVVHVEAVAPGCHFEGNTEHWYCTECEQVWSNKELTQLTNHKNVVIAATGEGNVVHMEAVAPGCHFEGHIEHWYCTECEVVWADEALTQITNHKNVILPATGGDVIHVDAKAPTAYEDGCVEHWYCEECEVVWADEALTQITNHKNVIIPATGEKVESSTSNDEYYTNVFEAEEDSEEYQNAVEVMKDVIKDKLFAVLEINLFTVEGNDQITELDGFIYVTIPVPAGVVAEEGQVLVVYRVNDDGSYTKCDTTVDGDEITFKTNHFSTYVVVAEDVEPEVPTTGDSANFVLWISVLALGFVAIAASVVMKKREF